MKVFSSHISAVEYDRSTETLQVLWSRGGTTTYDGVPEEVARRVLTAPSIGEALHRNIRGLYHHTTRQRDE